jgi:hypothetical protein
VSPDKDGSVQRPSLRNSPALNVTRPLIIAAIVVAAYDFRQTTPTRFIIAAVLSLVAALLAFVSHTAFSRSKEHNGKVRCG